MIGRDKPPFVRMLRGDLACRKSALIVLAMALLQLAAIVAGGLVWFLHSR